MMNLFCTHAGDLYGVYYFSSLKQRKDLEKQEKYSVVFAPSAKSAIKLITKYHPRHNLDIFKVERKEYNF